MNHLAHQYLSFSREPLMVGNFIADAVKGKQLLEFPLQIKTGIEMHRMIDSYTDTHPVVLATKKLLYPYFGKYAAVVQDMYYDHFLAVKWKDYHPAPLEEFCETFYAVILRNQNILPTSVKRMAGYMISQNWLTSYRTKEGVVAALTGLSGRASFPSNMQNSMEPLKEHYKTLSEHFQTFFPLLEKEIFEKFKKEINQIQILP